MSAHTLSTSPAAFSRAYLLADSLEERPPRHVKRRRTLSTGTNASLAEVDEDAIVSENEDDEAGKVSRKISRRISTLSARDGFKKGLENGITGERTPLLLPVHSLGQDNALPLPDTGQDSAWSHESGLIARYSLPILAATLCEYSLVIATTISVGHLSTTALAAASLASLTINVTTLSIVHGLCTALDTLCSQAAGSEKPELAGLHAQRSCIILTAIVPFQIAFCWLSEPVLLAMGQDPDVSRLAAQYLKVMSCGVPAYALFEVLRRWLQAQGIMKPPTIAVVVFTPVNVFLQWFLVWGPANLGFPGAPLATVISFNGMFIITALYCVFYAPRRCWAGFDRQAFKHLGPNLRLGLSGVLAVSSEWWAFEALGLGASYLGPLRLAGQSVILTTASLTYQIPYSLSVGASVRIGNLLGAGRADLAKVTLKCAIVMGAVIGLVNSAMLVAFRSYIPRIFTSDDEVVDLVSNVFPLVALFQIADSVNGVCSGILRGAGRSPLGAAINLVGYWLIGLPLAYVFAFHLDMQLKGLWIGITCALATCCVAFLWFTLRLDLTAELRRARERMI